MTIVSKRFKVRGCDTIYTLTDGPDNSQYEINWVNSSGEHRNDLKDRTWVQGLLNIGEWYYIDQATPVHIEEKPQSALDKQVSGNHYKDFKIQPVEYIYANNIPFLEANVIKYTSRHRAKNKAADIKKAIHCLELILQMEYGE